MTLHSIEAEVRSEIRKGEYRIKVSVLDLGFYVDGFRATRSDRTESGWWVQEPATRSKNGKWIKCPEFNKHLSLWEEIEAAVIACVNEYERTSTTPQASAGPEQSDENYPWSNW